MSDLEKDFSLVAEQINNHLKEAADALAKAKAVAKSVGVNWIAPDYYNDPESDDEVSLKELVEWDNLLSNLESLGWQTSGMQC